MCTFSHGESVPKSSCRMAWYFSSSAAISADISQRLRCRSLAQLGDPPLQLDKPFSRSTMTLLLMNHVLEVIAPASL